VTEPSHAVFLSYASQDAEAAKRICEALRAAGIEVWFDQSELRGGDAWDRQIRKQIHDCALFVPVISVHSDARHEGYFRREWRLAVERTGDMAEDMAFLLPVVVDNIPDATARVPDGFRAVQWSRLPDGQTSPAFVELVQRLLLSASTITSLSPTCAVPAAVKRAPPDQPRGTSALSAAAVPRVGICVLPFANMSGDQEQEYFSDGITEDIITDLSKVSALAVVSRNSAFMYKGKHVDVTKVARELKVGHVLEGSVRKAGGRVRITAQLVDGSSNDHVWAERYDRDLNDIFALQDEISEAIVKALKLKLLPEEKKAIEQRGTDNVEAYNLYLLARQSYITGHEADARRTQAMIRLCSRAIEIDPGYSRALALMAIGQMNLHFVHSGTVDDGLASAERAVGLDANLAEAHAVKARILARLGRHDEAAAEIDVALRLDPESYEVNRAVAYLRFSQRRLDEAIRYYEKSMSLMETDLNSGVMLLTCYTAVGNSQAARRVAQITLSRTEKTLAHDPNNGTAMAYGVSALATLGEAERAKGWMSRALLINPDDMNARYNFACTLVTDLKDFDAALELLGSVFETLATGFLNHANADPDLDPLRDDPRFKAMVAAAETRLAAANDGRSVPRSRTPGGRRKRI
jgi:adenylate cyclase